MHASWSLYRGGLLVSAYWVSLRTSLILFTSRKDTCGSESGVVPAGINKFWRSLGVSALSILNPKPLNPKPQTLARP